MTDTTPTHCGHDPRFVVSADEGTAYCAMCELEAVRANLAAVEIALARIEHSGGVNSLAFVEMVRAAMNGEEQA